MTLLDFFIWCVIFVVGMIVGSYIERCKLGARPGSKE